MTEIHLTADTDVWTGASTTALLAARAAADAVIISAGDDAVVQRLAEGGVRVIKCPMGGFLGALNLSRALRHVEGRAFEVYVHSPAARKIAEEAMKLVGRQEAMVLMPDVPPVEFPPVDVVHPGPDEDPLIMWLGNITEKCGLRELIEELGTMTAKQWRLRVVGQGKARVVSPILKRAKALGIDGRIEWVGYSTDPYRQMEGVSAAIVAGRDSVVAREFAAASIPVYTKLSDII